MLTVLVWVLAGCGVPAVPQPLAPTLSLVSPTPPLPSSHYAPAAYTTHLAFDYPAAWLFSEEKSPYGDTIFLDLLDPLALSLATCAPGEQPRATPSDFGRIYISIEPVVPGETLEMRVQEQIHADTISNTIRLLSDYPLDIDGHVAYALERQETIPELYTSVMFARRIFFIAYERLYTLDLLVAEKDRGGTFERGYDYFLKSLKVVP
jgi:hypothetical protein